MMRIVASVLVAAVLLGARSPAQTMAFEVASVKPSAPQAQMYIQLQQQPGGSVIVQNMPLRSIVEFAYQLQREDDRLIDVPDWMATERFDIQAKAPEGTQLGTVRRVGGPSPGLLMLRTLLAERFGLRLRAEMRERPILALVPASADRRLGPKLTRSDVDCERLAADQRAGRAAPTPPPAPGTIAPCRVYYFLNRIVVGSQPLAELADYLSASLRRQIVDRTGLAGPFDFELVWTPEQPRPADSPDRIVVGGTEIDLTGGVTIDPNGAGLITAVREQLGLKLESTRGPVEVLVVQAVTRPTAN
jgi:uncharacterized protein (TIGR03435 family)